MALTKIPASLLDKSSHVDFADNEQLRLGSGADGTIHHDGSHFRLRAGTGNFNVQANDFHITDASNSSARFVVDHDGETRLYYNGGIKLQTTNTGISVNEGKLTISEVTGSDAYTQIRKTNTGSNLALVSQESIYMMLDENNDQTNRSFQIKKNAGAPASGSILFLVEESGNSTVYGNLAVTGDLNITGDINSVSVTDLDVVDKTITLGKGQTESASGGSGIIVDGSSASILWDESTGEWDFNNPLSIVNSIGGDTVLNLTGSYGSGNNVALLGFARSGGAVSGDIRYVDATTDMEIGTGTAHAFSLKTSGTRRLYIASGGNIGIGQTNPQDKLHLLDGDIGIENSSGRRYRLIAETNGGFTIRDQNAAAGRFNIDTSGYNNIAQGARIGFTSGNQGSSAEIFTVYHASTGHSRFVNTHDSYSTMYIKNTSTTADTNQPFLTLQDTGGNRGNIGLRYSDARLVIQGHGGVGIRGGSGFSGEPSLFISSSGNVGVGNGTNIDGKFHIHQGSAGSVTASTDKNTLVVENSTHGGITTLTPDASESGIFFGHASGARTGEIYTKYGDNLMTIGSRKSGMAVRFFAGNATEVFRLRGDGTGLEFPDNNTFISTAASAGGTNYEWGSIRRPASSDGGQLSIRQYSTGSTAASYPAYAGGNAGWDENTGMYFPAADKVGLSGGGNVRLETGPHSTSEMAAVKVNNNSVRKAGTMTVYGGSSTAVNGGVLYWGGHGSWYEHVVQNHTTTGANRYWHIETNITTSMNVMFYAHYEGYAYGNSGNYAAAVRTGYMYSPNAAVINTVHKVMGSTGDLNIYNSSNNRLTFRADFGGGYYSGGKFSIGFPAPAGYSFDFQIVSHSMNGTSGSHY